MQANNTIRVEEKIPLLTYYSPSHEQLFNNFFYPSYHQHLSDDFELTVQEGKQLCTGEFGSVNFNQQMKEKICFVNDFIQQASSGYVIFSDVDIVFFGNIKQELIRELGDNDMVFQSDGMRQNGHYNLCCGFFCCKVNQVVKDFFSNMISNYNNRYSDQQNMNSFLSNSAGIRYKPLSKRFYNFSHGGHGVWRPEQEIPFPDHEIAMYHANYTVGIVNKEYLLENFIAWNDLKAQLARNLERVSTYL